MEKKIERITLEVFTSAGINDLTGFHTLRHSIATHLMNGNVAVHKVRTHLRHDNISTTDKYSHSQDIEQAIKNNAYVKI